MPTKTELIWEGKYDANGKRGAPVRVALPFQTVETVNESAQDRRDLFQLASQEKPWRNRLIWGDKKYVLPSLLTEFAGKVNLIYIDPPFDTGADFSFTASVPDAKEDGDDAIAFTKEPSVIEQKAYRDTWGRGLDSYLQWFYETAVLLRELLAETGTLYVHLDWHVGHFAKAVLDEIFGPENFVNELVWQKIRSSKGQSLGFGNVHDSIFVYASAPNFVFNRQFVPLSEERLSQHYSNIEPNTGRRYMLDNFAQAGQGEPRKFGKLVLAPPKGKHWTRRT
jgi:adenine-specific DNA-methyltransferase